jgi:hypothetical protein
MMDGRNYASWQPEAVINKRIQKQENIHSNWSYRQYMTHHGLEIMRYNTTEACNEMGLNQHTETSKTPSANVPILYTNIFDTAQPGYGYCNSDLKNPYMSREQLQARMIAPSIYYPTDENPINSVKNE